jgi:murein DD-endopeptidase MepM/ murein hydrolase activator NlpD
MRMAFYGQNGPEVMRMLRQRMRVLWRRWRFRLRSLPPALLAGVALLALGSLLAVWRLQHLPAPRVSRPSVQRRTPPAVHAAVRVPSRAPAAAPAAVSPRATRPVPPLVGRMVLGYGWVFSPTYQDWRFHDAWDLAAPFGTPVRAALAGRVSFVNRDPLLGTQVGVSDGGGLETVYAGLTAVRVAAGDPVEAGQVLAQVGVPGLAGSGEGDHLHFEVLRDGVPEDPARVLGSAPGGAA